MQIQKTVACMPGSEEREIEIRTPPETVLIVKRSSRDDVAMQGSVDTRAPCEASEDAMGYVASKCLGKLPAR